MKSQIRPAVVSLLMLTIVTGVIYPAVVTLVATTLFPSRARGTLVVDGGRVVGSELIGQPFDDVRYFWPRPSATGPYPYNAAASAGSNLGPTNPALATAIAARVKALRDADPSNTAEIPVDLTTASASGLDPDISVEAAKYQVRRVARARGLSTAELDRLVVDHTQERTFGLLGERRVNVLRLNLALDRVDAAGR